MAPQRIRLLALLAFVGVVAACDSPTNNAVTTVPVPRAATDSGSAYALLVSDTTADVTQTAVIDQNGGSILIPAGGVLKVPAGAVASATTFTFRLYMQPYIGTQLTAIGSDGQPVTVFPVPLTLTVSFAHAKDQLPDPSKLVLLWMENGVVMGQAPGTVDVQGQRLIATLTHFTDYTPGVPNDAASPFQVQ